MSRQTRLILVLAVMALAGVISLGLIAERYSRLHAARSSPGASVAAATDAGVRAFVQVRRGLIGWLDSGALDDVDAAVRVLAFNAERERRVALARIAAADYREMREHYRAWLVDPERLDPAWRAAFGRQRAALERCGLGGFEELDR